ncbi:MAG: hypothetical protein ABL928_00785 [Sphingorhabdus sp.]
MVFSRQNRRSLLERVRRLIRLCLPNGYPLQAIALQKDMDVTFLQQRTARSFFKAGRKVGRSREERGEAAGLIQKGEGVFDLAAKLLVGNVALSGRVPQKL